MKITIIQRNGTLLKQECDELEVSVNHFENCVKLDNSKINDIMTVKVNTDTANIVAYQDLRTGAHRYTCSACGRYVFGTDRYCRYCGAKFKGITQGANFHAEY